MPVQFRASIDTEIDYRPPPMTDRVLEGVDVQLYGMFHDRSSIPNVCRQIGNGLRDQTLTLGVHSYSGDPAYNEGLDTCRGIDPKAPICLFYGLPDRVRKQVLTHPTRVIGLACETDRVPSLWAECCNQFHLVVVPSRYCQQSLINSGVTAPILIAAHGLEPDYQPRPRKRSRSPFVFYNVINADRPERKGLRELLIAFQIAFAGRSDVRLRLRTERSEKVMQAFVAAGISDADARIEMIEGQDLPTAQFAAAYSDVHCTVHPSHAEGFGLIPLQSIACQTPVIAPAATGLADYINSNNAVLLRTAGQSETPSVYYQTGTHPLIDTEHLVSCLRYMERHWESEYLKVKAISAAHRAQFAWPSVLAPLSKLIAHAATLSDPGSRRQLLAEAASR